MSRGNSTNDGARSRALVKDRACQRRAWDYLSSTRMSKGPYTAAALELSHKATVGELASAALASAAQQIQRNTRGARDDRGPDHGHQLRIGLRRARVVVRLFSRRIGKRRAAALQRELRWAFRRIGELRDYDMLLMQVIEPLAVDEVMPALELLAREVMRRRKRAARAVKRALGSGRYLTLLRDVDRLERELARVVEAHPHGRAQRSHDKRARKWIKKRLDARLGAVVSMRDVALGRDEAAQHALRKQLKKLRYVTELVRGLWAKKRVKHYLSHMKTLQDTLGAINDAVSARRLLHDLEPSEHGDLSAALALCEGQLDAQLAEQSAKLAPALAVLETSPPFWR